MGKHPDKGWGTVGSIRQHIWNLHNGAPQDCSANCGILPSGPRKFFPPSSYTLGSEAIRCGGAEKHSIKLQDEDKLRLTEPSCAPGDGIEHALECELSAVDKLKQVGCGSLSLMRFAQLSFELRDPASKVLLCPGVDTSDIV